MKWQKNRRIWRVERKYGNDINHAAIRRRICISDLPCKLVKTIQRSSTFIDQTGYICFIFLWTLHLWVLICPKCVCYTLTKRALLGAIQPHLFMSTYKTNHRTQHRGCCKIDCPALWRSYFEHQDGQNNKIVCAPELTF